MLDFLTALWLGVLGACIGSFLNVVAYRMPRGVSVVWKPSYCPKCGRSIRPRDNLPVAGWLLLGGRCRDCGEKISPRYAVVEAVMGGAFLALAYAELLSGGANLPGGAIAGDVGAAANVWNPNWPLIGLYTLHCVMLALLMCYVLIDADGATVPWKLIAAAVAAGIAAPLMLQHYRQPVDVFSQHLWGGGLGGSPPALQWIVQRAVEVFLTLLAAGILGMAPHRGRNLPVAAITAVLLFAFDQRAWVVFLALLVAGRLVELSVNFTMRRSARNRGPMLVAIAALGALLLGRPLWELISTIGA